MPPLTVEGLDLPVEIAGSTPTPEEHAFIMQLLASRSAASAPTPSAPKALKEYDAADVPLTALSNAPASFLTEAKNIVEGAAHMVHIAAAQGISVHRAVVQCGHGQLRNHIFGQHAAIGVPSGHRLHRRQTLHVRQHGGERIVQGHQGFGHSTHGLNKGDW